jgi:hypothetical protein
MRFVHHRVSCEFLCLSGDRFEASVKAVTLPRCQLSEQTQTIMKSLS